MRAASRSSAPLLRAAGGRSQSVVGSTTADSDHP